MREIYGLLEELLYSVVNVSVSISHAIARSTAWKRTDVDEIEVG
jgi:hypothetical protein